VIFDLLGRPSFPLLLLELVVIGNAWYLAICGGLHLWLDRSRFAARAARWKTQPAAPRRSQVRGELRDGVLSMSAVMVVVALSFWMGQHGYSRLYADPGEYGFAYIGLSIFFVFLTMEVFEWAFHWACHHDDRLWKVHRHHHRYSNPTPLGVMADHPIDMLVKASPILWVPLIFPIWDVALVGTFATLNFLYGTYLHGGFDPPFMPSPHSRFLVSAWHHNEHHAGSMKHNFGFFTGFMDLAFGTRLTPADKSARRPGYRCPECRNAGLPEGLGAEN